MNNQVKFINGNIIEKVEAKEGVKAGQLVTEEQIVVHGEANVILAIDELSKSHAQTLGRLSEDIKITSQMINDSLNGDPSYREMSEKVKVLNKEKLKIKQSILSYDSNKQLTEKLKELRADKKEKQLALSDYLLELERMTGANQLELFDGTVYEIKKTATLTKRLRLK